VARAFLVAALAACGRLDFAEMLVDPVVPVYPDHAAWSSYIKNHDGGTSLYDQPEIDCSGDEQGPDSCLQAGALREARVHLASCSGLSAADSLGAFGWICDDRGGSVTFYSTGLAPNHRLGDLVDDRGFLPDQLVVSLDGAPIGQTAPAVWWNDQVVPLPDNSAPGTAVAVLAAAGTIYAATTTRMTHGYNIQADHVSIAVARGAELDLALDTPPNCNMLDGGVEPPPPPDDTDMRFFRPCLIAAGAFRFLWIEGRFDNKPGMPSVDDFTTTIALQSSAHVVLRHIASQNGGYGILLGGVTSSLFYDLTLMNHSKYGVLFDSTYDAAARPSTDNVLSGLVVADVGVQTGSTAILLDNLASRNILTRLHVSGTSNACILQYGNGNEDNVFSHLTAIGCYYNCLRIDPANHVTVVQANLSDCANDGLYITDVPGARLAQIVSTHQNGFAITLVGTATSAQLAENLGWGSNSSGDCNGCTIGSAHVRSGLALNATFVGRSASDTANPAGATNESESAIADWIDFESPFRAWGSNAPSFPDPTLWMPCRSGTCQIWDWRLRADDAVLLARSDSGASPNAPFAAGAPCPAAVDGDRTITDATGTHTFLANATEVLFDGLGNDNGLCETGEACVYSPNYGAYQGEGALVGPCTFHDGAVTGVTMFAHAQNGVVP
jgi:hypothetical protein